MFTKQALISGLVGASSLTLLHELARRFIPHAPRADVLGMRAIAQGLRSGNQPSPPRTQLYWLALIGDLLSNALYYSLVGVGNRRHTWRRGVLLGSGAGLGTAFLPRFLGLGRQPGQATPATQLMTIAWYLIGGLASAATSQQLTSESQPIQSSDEQLYRAMGFPFSDR